METILSIGLGIVLVALAGELVLILGLAREVGRLQMRLGPVGARETDSGPAVGERPLLPAVRDQFDRALALDGGDGRNTLLMFVSPDCPVCESLMPGLQSMARNDADQLRIVLISDGEPESHEHFRQRTGIDGRLDYVVSAETGMSLRIGVTPYGVLLDEEGIVRAKGLCNHIQHVESLLNARRLGLSSLEQVTSVSELLAADRAATDGRHNTRTKQKE